MNGDDGNFKQQLPQLGKWIVSCTTGLTHFLCLEESRIEGFDLSGKSAAEIKPLKA